jgi:hypothetical protein
MLEHLTSKVTARKARLYACAWGYLLWDRMIDERSRQALITAERYADGHTDLSDLPLAFNAAQAARRSIHVAFRGHRKMARRPARAAGANKNAAEVARNAADPNKRYRLSSYRDTDKTVFALSNIVRDLFGNPFRTVSLDPSWTAWNDGASTKLAQAIYEEAAYSRLPLLADALEDAGCTYADILAHCRTPGEHVRGCLVVDLLLGQKGVGAPVDRL